MYKSNLYQELKDKRETKQAIKHALIIGAVSLSYFIGHLIVYLIK